MPTSRTVRTTNTSPTSQPREYFGMSQGSQGPPREYYGTSQFGHHASREYFTTDMTDRQGGYGDIGADRNIIDSGDSQQIADRVSSIFANRDVDLSTGAMEGESEQQRIARISQEIVDGRRGFGDVRRSVDRLAQNADHTRASAGLPAVTQPQLSPEHIGELMRGRNAASSQFRQTEADALEAEAQARFQADLQQARLQEQFGQQRRQQMDQAGDVGMAFQPVGAGRAMRASNEAEAFDVGEVGARRDFQLSQLAEMVAAARRQRDTQLGDLDAREQEMRSALVRDELANFGSY